jgi:hypothetical protein
MKRISDIINELLHILNQMNAAHTVLFNLLSFLKEK